MKHSEGKFAVDHNRRYSPEPTPLTEVTVSYTVKVTLTPEEVLSLDRRCAESGRGDDISPFLVEELESGKVGIIFDLADLFKP